MHTVRQENKAEIRALIEQGIEETKIDKGISNPKNTALAANEDNDRTSKARFKRRNYSVGEHTYIVNFPRTTNNLPYRKLVDMVTNLHGIGNLADIITEYSIQAITESKVDKPIIRELKEDLATNDKIQRSSYILMSILINTHMGYSFNNKQSIICNLDEPECNLNTPELLEIVGKLEKMGLVVRSDNEIALTKDGINIIMKGLREFSKREKESLAEKPLARSHQGLFDIEAAEQAASNIHYSTNNIFTAKRNVS